MSVLHVPDFQVCVCGEESLVVGWSAESLFPLRLCLLVFCRELGESGLRVIVRDRMSVCELNGVSEKHQANQSPHTCSHCDCESE